MTTVRATAARPPLPKTFHGVADVYRWVADSLAARPVAEGGELPQSGPDVISRLSDA